MATEASAERRAENVIPFRPQSTATEIDVSVVMPCLNEADALAECVEAAQLGFRRAGVRGEVVVVDNGSDDGSPEIAAAAGAWVIQESERGYGNALRRGFREAHGRVLIMGDADGTYDFERIDLLLEGINDGADLVLGDRLGELLEPDAMPFLHRTVGTPGITFLLRIFTGSTIRDSQSGMRAIRRERLEQLELHAEGMEFASEMLYQAAWHRLQVDEVTVPYRRRTGDSKLHTFRDGWRHLRYLVLRSPTHVFTIPGLLLLVAGLGALGVTLWQGDGVAVGSLRWQPVLAGPILLVGGANALLLGLLAKIYGIQNRLQRPDWSVRMYWRYVGFERLLIAGLVFVVVGGAIDVTLLARWLIDANGGNLRLAVLGQTFLILGAVVTFGSRGDAFRHACHDRRHGKPGGGRPGDGRASQGRLTSMRIGFLYDALYPFTQGGGERRYWEIARRLAASHEVHMVAWKYWEGPDVIERDGVQLHGIGRPPALYSPGGRRSIREAVSFGLHVARARNLPRFDVVDCCAFPYFHLLPQRARSWWRREPLVATWHEFWGGYWGQYLQGPAAIVGRCVERVSVPAADQYIAVSEHTAARLRAQGASGRISVVPNGIDLAAIDARAGIEDEACGPDVLYVGRMIAHKRVDLLLHAVAILRAGGRPLRLTLVGDGPEAERWETLAGQLGLRGTVQFCRSATDDQMYGLMRRACLLALPSEREGFGMTVLEAAACGTPSLVTRAPHSAAPELIREGQTGLVTAPTPEAIAAGIRSVVECAEQARDMGAQAREYAERFDWLRVADMALDVYEHVLADRRR